MEICKRYSSRLLFPLLIANSQMFASTPLHDREDKGIKLVDIRLGKLKRNFT